MINLNELEKLAKTALPGKWMELIDVVRKISSFMDEMKSRNRTLVEENSELIRNSTKKITELEEEIAGLKEYKWKYQDLVNRPK
jgi:hypothetical protein